MDEPPIAAFLSNSGTRLDWMREGGMARFPLMPRLEGVKDIGAGLGYSSMASILFPFRLQIREGTFYHGRNGWGFGMAYVQNIPKCAPENNGALLEIVHGVPEELDSVAFPRGGLVRAAQGVLAGGPVGMVGPVVERLGVGHEAEHAARGIADAGDVPRRAVGVEGKLPLRGPSVGEDVAHHGLAVFPDLSQDFVFRVELSFPMAYGEFHGGEPPGEDARGSGVEGEVYPPVPKPAAVVIYERDFAL